MPDTVIALILGIVEGLTEFIPVSSTGHLILFGQVLNFQGPVANTFNIFIQLGAILAVVVLYFPRFLGLLDFSRPAKSTACFRGLTGTAKLFLACLPAFVAGALLHHTIKTYLFFPGPVTAALIAGGIIMILTERREPMPALDCIEQISYRQAFLIGLVQCFSLWPGVSRSAATIVGGMLFGLNRQTAAEFSFLVAVPVMCGAVVFDLFKSWNLLDLSQIPLFAIGFVVSFLTAMLAIRFFLSLLRRFTLVPFAVYRIILGVFVLLACCL